jgi:hypothetical protein
MLRTQNQCQSEKPAALSLADRAEIGQWRLSCGCEEIIVITVGAPPWVVLCMNHSQVRWYMECGEC